MRIGVHKISIEIVDQNGVVVNEVIDIPNKEDLKEIIEHHIKAYYHPIDKPLKGLLMSIGLGGSIVLMVASLSHAASYSGLPLGFAGFLLSIFGVLGSLPAAYYGGEKIEQIIHAKQHHNHVQHLSNNKSVTLEKRVSP